MVFLHKRAAQQADLIAFVASKAEETTQLDFKREFWKDVDKSRAGEEAAKDVAAMANTDGGDIIIGINDDGHRANGWFPNPNTDGKTDGLRRMLLSHLEPQDLANFVEIRELKVDVGGESQPAMVVSVPAWGHGPVASCLRNPSQDAKDTKQSYLFPFRVGQDIRYMSLGEAMYRNDAARRSQYVRALEIFTSHPGAYAMPLAPLAARFDETHIPIPAIVADATTGRAVALPSLFRLERPTRDGLFFSVPETRFAVGGYKVEVPANKFFVPFEFVEALWPINNQSVRFALSEDILLVNREQFILNRR